MRLRMASLRGPKALLWVTYGIPSEIRYVDTGWVDNAPFLRQMGARFMQSDITVYTAEPGTSLERGILDRNSLDILAGATGGHAFSTVDLTRAIAQIQADSRTTYSLDFQPPAKGLDGKYHKLQVSVDRKGVRLQTEAGYYAISGS
jgi:VWFA-related protein